MTFLEANLAALEKYQPNLVEELRRQSSAKALELIPLLDEIPSVDAVVVVGLPTRESWAKLLGSRTPFLLVAHDPLPELRAYLSVINLQEAFTSGRISFAVGEDGVLQLLNDLFGTLYRRQVTLFGRPDQPAHRAAVKDMNFFETLCAANRATLDQFAVEWQNNLSENFRDFLTGPFLQDESGSWKEAEALVVAAGPSLDEFADPELFRNIPVIACDTAVPVLAARGVTPDLIATLDSSEPNLTYLRDLPGEIYEKSVLCVTPLVDRKVYQPFKNVLFYSYGHPTLDHLRGCGIPFDPVATGGSVALTALDIARLLGAAATYLLGYDFQFYKYRTHARGTGAALRSLKTIGRFATIEQSLYEYQNDMDASKTEREGVEGQDAMTDKKFQKWRDWLELYVKNNDLKVFQMSSRTARIEGVKFGKPEKHPRTRRPLQLRRHTLRPEILRELKFLAKELEMALSAPAVEITRRITALPRVGNCLGYIMAWLSGKPPETSAVQLRDILQKFRKGVAETLKKYEAGVGV